MVAICASVSVVPACGGGMRVAGFGGADARKEAALRRIAGSDDVIAAAIGAEAVLGVEPEVGDAPLVVGAVAGEAVVRENRPDVAVEIDGLVGGQTHAGQRD